ncbi:hypothetical protein [Streptococcus oricebi]|uniref:Uncharacterized protein n=1 Tax=Streptococcus oricebi TaxID=1547447 RepID=A0ABS5B414_9STRE|nr:hypothetical protein [Streptococcus oricebi]MBP2623549.1 hypothetical protein [Streptococcus oricebi]
MKNTIGKKWNKWNIGCSGFLIVVLLFIVYIVVGGLNYGKYTLRPGESVKIEVNSLTNQPDYSSELELDNLNGAKLQLSNSPRRSWKEYIGEERNKFISYDTKTQKVTSYNWDSGEKQKQELENSPQQDVYLKGQNLIIQSKGKRLFGVTNSKKYYLIIKNLSNKPAHFKATVTNR